MGYNNKKANLTNAKKAKNYEFYTLLKDVEKEVSQYNLEGKIIYCNCDDYRYSNFVKYFKDNFEKIKIKKLIATNYDMGDGAFVYEYDGVNELVQELNGNGDFRSDECITYLQESDVVITNPPFGLFREYIKQLMDYGKKFLIIGNNNAVTYKEIFPYIKSGELRLGHSSNKTFEFKVPDGYTFNREEDGVKYGKVPAISWFTNLETHKADDPMELVEKYDPVKFPKYDNYDAINIDKVVDIPYNYDGVMGVPITIVDKVADDGFIHCSRNGDHVKFKLVALGNSRENFTPTKDYINPKKHKPNGDIVNGNAINCVLAIDYINKPKGIYYTSDNSNYLFAPYARILIKKYENSTNSN